MIAWPNSGMSAFFAAPEAAWLKLSIALAAFRSWSQRGWLRISRFLRHPGGATATLFALALPVIAAATCGAVDIVTVVRGKTILQSAADNAALVGALQMGFDQSPATTERTIRLAAAANSSLGAGWTTKAAAQADIVDGTMTVNIDAIKASYFGALIGPTGWPVHVTSTAVMNARRPLCVLALRTSAHDVLHVQDQSLVLSPDCMIQSDSDVHADNQASITAGDVRAVTSSQGSVTPAALTGAPSIADPFSNLDITIPTTCNDSDNLQFSSGTQSLNPGVHCGNVRLDGTATLILNPGEHYFIKGNFHSTGSAQLTGTDVTLIFKANYSLKFDQSSSMTLEGRQSGPYAGFVLITGRQYNGNFEIATDRARKLLGTIYLPNATLVVQGDNNKVADQSPWTVIVANMLTVSGSAQLVVNANYSASVVPVPTGVGNSARFIRLSN